MGLIYLAPRAGWVVKEAKEVPAQPAVVAQTVEQAATAQIVLALKVPATVAMEEMADMAVEEAEEGREGMAAEEAMVDLFILLSLLTSPERLFVLYPKVLEV